MKEIQFFDWKKSVRMGILLPESVANKLKETAKRSNVSIGQIASEGIYYRCKDINDIIDKKIE